MRIRTVHSVPVRGHRVTPEAIQDWDGMAPHRPRLDEWAAKRLLAGMHPKALAIACSGEMSLRTAYRWRRTLLHLEVVELGGMRATFAVRRGGPPARISDWVAA